MDLTKGTRKETQAPQGEEIITGVTHNSILKFVDVPDLLVGDAAQTKQLDCTY